MGSGNALLNEKQIWFTRLGWATEVAFYNWTFLNELI